MTDGSIPKTEPGNIGCRCGAVSMGLAEYRELSGAAKAAFGDEAAACVACPPAAPKSPAPIGPA